MTSEGLSSESLKIGYCNMKCWAMSQNGMVRPCSSPASEPNWQGGTEDKGACHDTQTQ
jgi:hypothetical protein